MPKTSIQFCARARQAPGDHVDADVLVLVQHVRRAEQEDRREQVPLDLEQPVGAPVERVADDGVAGADDDDDQDRARSSPCRWPRSCGRPPARRQEGRSRFLRSDDGRGRRGRAPSGRQVAALVLADLRRSARCDDRRDYMPAARGRRARPGRLPGAMLKCPTSPPPRARHVPSLPHRRPGRPGAVGRHRRREPAPGRPHRADRVGELREPGGDGGAGVAAHQQVRRGLPRASATTAAASTSTSPSSSRSTGRRSCSAPSSPTCSPIPVRRPTRRSSWRR